MCEVDLCGHATLASAHVLFQHLDYPKDSLVFNTQGDLVVKEKNGLIVMDFPALHSTTCMPPEKLVMGLGKIPVEKSGFSGSQIRVQSVSS